MKTVQVFAFVLSVCGGAAAQTTYTITQQGAPNCVFAGINEWWGRRPMQSGGNSLDQRR